MKKILLSICVCLVILAGFGYVYRGQASKPKTIPTTAEMVFGSSNMRLDVVSTDAARQKGLSGRSSLPANIGMLFVFPGSDTYDFWMKDMHFPIDILWIKEGKVVDLVTLNPPRDGQEPERHVPKSPAEYVLEVQAGLSRRMGIGIGSSLVLPKL